MIYRRPANVNNERSFVNAILTVFVALQMARPVRSAIEMFVVQLDKLPESVTDDNGNDNYVPKADFMGEWTALSEKVDGGLFALRFTYELETRPN